MLGVPTDHVFACVEDKGTHVFYSPSIEGELTMRHVLLRRDGDGVLRPDGEETDVPDANEVLFDPDRLRRYLA